VEAIQPNRFHFLDRYDNEHIENHARYLSNPGFWVRDIPVYGDAILSPMDGVSDWPFRSLCRALGSAMSYTEFVRAEDVLQGRKSVDKRLTFEPSERPVVFQIYGDDPDQIVEAALRIRDLGAGLGTGRY
jgi:tRNA-dihydrouridine synthase B